MKIKIYCGLFCGLFASFFTIPAFGQFVINEIDSNTPSTDMLEFVEIYDGGSGNTSLDGHVLVLFNGSDDASYAAFDLTGGVTNGDGFFVIGSVSEADMPFPGSASGRIQNGADAVALYTGSVADFPGDTPATTTNLIDAIVYDTSDADDAELLAVFGEAQINENGGGDDDNESIQRNPDGSSSFSTALPTPGSSNDMDPLFELIFDTVVVSETDGMGAITVCVIVSEVVTADLVLNVTISDGTELAGPVTVTIPEGDDFIDFELDAIDDNLMDGNQSVTLTVSAAGFQDAVQILTVADDELILPAIVINEMRVSAAGADDPEFVELFNNGSVAIDLSGWTVSAFESDSADVDFGSLQGTFTIPTGTMISAGDFYLVGNAFFQSVFGMTPDFEADFDFGDGNITMVLSDLAGNSVYSVFSSNGDTDAQPTNGIAAVLPDITLFADAAFSPAGFFLDLDGGSTATNLDFTNVPDLFATPGTTNTVPISRLSVEVDTTLFSESDGVGVATATITRTNDVSGPLTVTVTSSDSSEVTTQSATVQFAASEVMQTVILDAVDDNEIDGLQNVTITFAATGFVSGTATVSVTDDDSPLANLVINEMIIDSSGSDTEFLEIFNPSNVDVDLAGYSIERWESDLGVTGMDGGAAIVIPADSPVILPAGGFYLIGNDLFAMAYPGVAIDLMIASNSFENGSATIVLRDANANVIFTVFATDGGVGDAANIDGTPITPDLVANAIAFALTPDGGTTVIAIDNSVPSVDATPGASNEEGVALGFEVSIADCSFVNGNFVIDFTANGSSDIYVSSDLQGFSLAPNGAGVASGIYTDPSPPSGRAFYLIQEAGSPAP